MAEGAALRGPVVGRSEHGSFSIIIVTPGRAWHYDCARYASCGPIPSVVVGRRRRRLGKGSTFHHLFLHGIPQHNSLVISGGYGLFMGHS